MSKTIKELAEELRVSKTAIRKKLTPEFRELYVETDEKGTLLVSDEGANLLQSLRKPVETTENQLPETGSNQLPPDREAWYQEQLRLKDEMINSLRDDNKQLSDRLLTLSEQVGDTLTAMSKGQLADKLIEGQKMMIESSDEKQEMTLGQWIKKKLGV